MKLNLGQCRRCGQITYLVEEAGMVWSADRRALGADEAVTALLAGRELYRIRFLGETPTDLSPARPATLLTLRNGTGERPVVVQNHGCPPGASRRLQKKSDHPDPRTTHQRPPCGQLDPFLGALSPGPCQQCGPTPY